MDVNDAVAVVLLRPEDRPNVYVKPSSLGPQAGLGLFAKRDFARGDVLCYYIGEKLGGRQASGLKDRAYLMRLCKNLSIDAGKSIQVGARYINDNADKSKINVRFQKEPDLCRASVVALRDMQQGEEVFVSYGKGYWKQRGVVPL